MNIAIAAYENRIAALLESSDRFILFKAPADGLKDSRSIMVHDNSPCELFNLLITNNIHTLICGAIKGCVQYQIEALNIRVIPWITGDLQKVVEAFLTDNLFPSSFLMPGYHHRGHHNRQRFRKGQPGI